MISARLLDARAVPRLRRRRSPGAAAESGVRRAARAPVRRERRDYLDLRPGVSFAEQTKYLDEALHADARHEHVVAAAALGGDPQRHAAVVPRARAAAIA